LTVAARHVLFFFFDNNDLQRIKLLQRLPDRVHWIPPLRLSVAVCWLFVVVVQQKNEASTALNIPQAPHRPPRLRVSAVKKGPEAMKPAKRPPTCA
jgi:hypothetical protein